MQHPCLSLQGPYAEPSSWGLKLMIRSSIVMLFGGSIAGVHSCQGAQCAFPGRNNCRCHLSAGGCHDVLSVHLVEPSADGFTVSMRLPILRAHSHPMSRESGCAQSTYPRAATQCVE
jgi:hypothetical protein